MTTTQNNARTLARDYASAILRSSRKGSPDLWWKTQDIAAAIGLMYDPGSTALRPLRDALYWLEVHGLVEHRPRHNGHLWRWRDV